MKAHTILFLAFFVFCNIFGNVMSGEILNEYKMADPSVSSVAIVDANTINELQFGEVAVLERSIKNTGSTIIEINGVYNMSCGCRGGSKIDKKTLKPGQTAVLRFQCNTFKKKLGLNTDTYAISTKSKQIIPIDGQAKVLVHKDIVFQPQNIELGKVIKDGEKSRG